MNISECRDILKEANDGIKALGEEVIALRKENKELKKQVANQPLLLTEDMEVKTPTDGRELI
jgi:hypothetical protein